MQRWIVKFGLDWNDEHGCYDAIGEFDAPTGQDLFQFMHLLPPGAVVLDVTPATFANN